MSLSLGGCILLVYIATLVYLGLILGVVAILENT
jgi:hypothetical protein